jgi:hypothetical protein
VNWIHFFEQYYSIVKQRDTCDQSLKEQSEAWPTAGERRKESLQG